MNMFLHDIAPENQRLRNNYTQSNDIKNGMAYDVFRYTLNGCE